jgi:hypothetical protein
MLVLRRGCSRVTGAFIDTAGDLGEQFIGQGQQGDHARIADLIEHRAALLRAHD